MSGCMVQTKLPTIVTPLACLAGFIFWYRLFALGMRKRGSAHSIDARGVVVGTIGQ